MHLQKGRNAKAHVAVLYGKTLYFSAPQHQRLWMALQKRFALRMKLIQCEIKSPVLYLRKAHRGNMVVGIAVISISARCSAGNLCLCLCMRKHALPTQHNTGPLTVLMLHSNFLTSHSMTFRFRCRFWA